MIKTNVNDFLEKIETEDTMKEALSVEELYKLAETPCKKPILKIASLFSCMTSLRISDILALCWEDIVDYSAGGKCVHIITQKNKAEDIIPISEEALPRRNVSRPSLRSPPRRVAAASRKTTGARRPPPALRRCP